VNKKLEKKKKKKKKNMSNVREMARHHQTIRHCLETAKNLAVVKS
jgi:hypothetical protein